MTGTAGYPQDHRPARPPAGHRLQMDDDLVADWMRLLRHRVGLFIAPERRSFLVSGVRGRMRESQCCSDREYYSRLVKSANSDQEWTLLIDRLTVHETSFFRHDSSIRLTAERLLPGSFAKRRACSAWSVGCATGEEAYSLAMLLDHAARASGSEWDWRMIGTDISVPSLQQAQAGVYLKRRLRDIPLEFRDTYCSDTSGNHFRIADRLRERITWTSWNLFSSEAAPTRNADVIYCQNVLIYYDRPQRVSIVERLAGCLAPGGVLVLGPGELMNWNNPCMEKVRYPDTLAYRRTH